MSYVNSDTIHGHHLSGSNKLVPSPRPGYLEPNVTTPAPAVITGRPSYVIVKDDRGDDISFLFNATGSIGSTITDDAQISWVNFGQYKDPTEVGNDARVDVSPVAWSGSHASAAAGDVIFVYNDGHNPNE
tara:strand:+ start:354 stop:743 length:390 start_codon:yes stop_codon:yes gene_type:complete